VILGLLALAFGATAAFAQAGRVEGTVRSITGDPLANVRVSIVNQPYFATTDAKGFYRLMDVPPGTYTVRGALVGYTPVTVARLQVAAGLPVTVNMEMTPAVVSLEEVVVTGTVGETKKADLPFTVASVKSEDIPVPQSDALSSLQGKVAGAIVVSGSGRPGAASTILLRGATAIDASGRSQEPLYVVDGVILGSGMVDLSSLDVESVEIVKGAAAASLYGSRAASGVVQIRTRRGASLAEDQVSFTVRSEYGINQLPGKFDLAMHHQFLMNSAGTKFIDNSNQECDWLDCRSWKYAGQLKTGVGADTVGNQWNTIQDIAWPGTAYDQVKRFFDGGDMMQQYVAAEGRSGNTNFHASWTNLRQAGVMTGQDGDTRNNFRINVDQSVGAKFGIGASAFYSYSKEDAASGALFDLTRMPAGVDLMTLNRCPSYGCTMPWQTPRMIPDPSDPTKQIQDPNDVYLQPDPFNNESPNPLYTALNDNNFAYRGRFLGSASGRFTPFTWVSFDANASYDRLDYKRQNYVFKGYKSTTSSPTTMLGNMLRRHELTTAFNASADVTFTKTFGDLATRTQFRYLAEYDDYEFTQANGSKFAVAEVPTLDNLDPTTISATSGLQPVRADGYFGITNLVYKDRYILDGLVRNDGSSLFGPDARRQWYYRIAGGWRLGRDLNISGLDELKLRAAYGTAGGRPNFEAQYETYSVSGGQVSPVTLGNKNLKPELSKELEVGVDLLTMGRIGLTVDYSRRKTSDQLLRVPLHAYAGFGQQWQNAGTLEGKTWEATLDLAMVQSRNVSWTAKVLFDRTRGKITELNVPPFTYGAFGGNSTDVFYARKGEDVGTIYGYKYAKSCADLLGGAGVTTCDEFAINDDGLLVWVGPGGSLDSPKWGTRSTFTFGFKGQKRALDWGAPVMGWGLDPQTGDTTNFLPIGKTTPDFHFGLSNSLRLGGLSIYGLVEWTQGISVYNVPQQWSIFKTYAGIMDQSGKAAADQKPVGYYNDLYGIVGLSPVNYFVQDGSFGKLREVSLTYRFDREFLARTSFLRAFDGLSISLIGRNLLTFTNYNGYDPETGSGGGDTGSAAIARVDGYQYPNFRTFSASIQVNF
jgi:TonB-linked SusC/RagA family outer membrane protein